MTYTGEEIRGLRPSYYKKYSTMLAGDLRHPYVCLFRPAERN